MLCVKFTAVFLILCHFYVSDACYGGNANAFIDEVLAIARPDFAQRMHLPDIHNGNLNLWDIYVWGFESFKRGGNVCFDTKGVGKQTVRAIFEINNVHGSMRGSYRGIFKEIGHKPGEKTLNFGVDVVIPNVKVRLDLDIDLNARKISLIDINFVSFDNGRFNVHLSFNLRLYNGVAVIVSRLEENFDKKQLIPITKTLLRDSLVKALTKFSKFDLIPH